MTIKNVAFIPIHFMPDQKPEGSEDFYDCSQFYDWDYNNKHKETFEDFVHAVLESVIEVDEECTKKLIAELQQDVDTKMNNIDELKNLL